MLQFDDWFLKEGEFDPEVQQTPESVLSQGNGYLGLRASAEEPYPGQCRGLFVAGTYDKPGPQEATELPNAADPVEMRLRLDGESFSLLYGTVEEYGRRLNLRTGELIRDILWKSRRGRRYRLRFGRFVSLARVHLIASRVEIHPLDGDCDVNLQTGLDGRCTNGGTQHFQEGERRLFNGSDLYLSRRTAESGIPFAAAATVRISGSSAAATYSVDRRRIEGRYSSRAGAAGLVVEKFTAIHTGRDADKPRSGDETGLRDLCLEDLRAASDAGYTALLAESSAAWEAYWKEAEVRIAGAGADEIGALRAAQYHLRCMTPYQDPSVGIGAKGLSGEGYRGHVFWDSELFILPYFLVTDPDEARSLLRYRYLTLDGARRKARAYGYAGAMFAWESAVTGDEETPDYAALDIISGKAARVWSGAKEHHVTADIAWAVLRYHGSTGDDRFMEECGWELLFECAWFWCSRVVEGRDGRLEIRDVIGPDEYTEHVDNNAYTNYLAQAVVSAAALHGDALARDGGEVWTRLNERLGLAARLPRYRDVAAHLYLPEPRQDGLIPQDDTFLSKPNLDITEYRKESGSQSILRSYSREEVVALQVLKQADVVMLLSLMGGRFPSEVRRKNLEYYEPRTIHDSSLSAVAHGLVALRCGMDASAFFARARAIDFGPNPHSSDQGIHAAAMAGIWQLTVFGYGGLRFGDDDVPDLDPTLPPQWTSMEYSFRYRSSRIAVRAEKDAFTLSVLSGPSVELRVRGSAVLVEAGPRTIRR